MTVQHHQTYKQMIVESLEVLQKKSHRPIHLNTLRSFLLKTYFENERPKAFAANLRERLKTMENEGTVSKDNQFFKIIRNRKKTPVKKIIAKKIKRKTVRASKKIDTNKMEKMRTRINLLLKQLKTIESEKNDLKTVVRTQKSELLKQEKTNKKLQQLHGKQKHSILTPSPTPRESRRGSKVVIAEEETPVRPGSRNATSRDSFGLRSRSYLHSIAPPSPSSQSLQSLQKNVAFHISEKTIADSILERQLDFENDRELESILSERSLENRLEGEKDIDSVKEPEGDNIDDVQSSTAVVLDIERDDVDNEITIDDTVTEIVIESISNNNNEINDPLSGQLIEIDTLSADKINEVHDIMLPDKVTTTDTTTVYNVIDAKEATVQANRQTEMVIENLQTKCEELMETVRAKKEELLTLQHQMEEDNRKTEIFKCESMKTAQESQRKIIDLQKKNEQILGEMQSNLEEKKSQDDKNTHVINDLKKEHEKAADLLIEKVQHLTKEIGNEKEKNQSTLRTIELLKKNVEQLSKENEDEKTMLLQKIQLSTLEVQRLANECKGEKEKAQELTEKLQRLEQLSKKIEEEKIKSQEQSQLLTSKAQQRKKENEAQQRISHNLREKLNQLEQLLTENEKVKRKGQENLQLLTEKLQQLTKENESEKQISQKLTEKLEQLSNEKEEQQIMSQESLQLLTEKVDQLSKKIEEEKQKSQKLKENLGHLSKESKEHEEEKSKFQENSLLLTNRVQQLIEKNEKEKHNSQKLKEKIEQLSRVHEEEDLKFQENSKLQTSKIQQLANECEEEKRQSQGLTEKLQKLEQLLRENEKEKIKSQESFGLVTEKSELLAKEIGQEIRNSQKLREKVEQLQQLSKGKDDKIRQLSNEKEKEKEKAQESQKRMANYKEKSVLVYEAKRKKLKQNLESSFSLSLEEEIQLLTTNCNH